MRTYFAVIAAFVCFGLLRQNAIAVQDGTTFEKLKTEFAAEQRKFYDDYSKMAKEIMQQNDAALKAATTPEEKRKVKTAPLPMLDPMGGPAPKFSKKFLDYAGANPLAPEVLDSLDMALATSGGPDGKAKTWQPTLVLLSKTFASSPGIKPIIRQLSRQQDDPAVQFLLLATRQNPDRKIQAMAFKALADGRKVAESMGLLYKQNSGTRDNAIKQIGAKRVDALIASIVENEKLGEHYREIVQKQYRDVMPDLSIGKPAPEFVSRTLDGNSVRLSGLKGKVVILDIWATWCGPCRAMIPHEREMVQRMKGRPFELVSISADEKRETLASFLEKEPMPWNHWWNGSTGGIIEDWDVQYYPTIYVIDAKGVIRHKDLRGAELEKAVEELLKASEGV